MRTLVTLIVIISLFASCNCIQEGEGIILDKQTGKPVDSVLVTTFDNSNLNTGDKTLVINPSYYSDIDGHFKFRNISGGIGRDCADLTIIFKKNGYEMKRMAFESISPIDTVYLENKFQE